MVPIWISEDASRWLPVGRSKRVEVVLVGHPGQPGTGAFVCFEHMPHGNPSASHVTTGLVRGFEESGRPRKGIVLMPSVWSSFRRICNSRLSEFVDIASYAQVGTDIDAMAVADRIEVERWIHAQALACSFTPYATRGDAVVTAIETAESRVRGTEQLTRVLDSQPNAAFAPRQTRAEALPPLQCTRGCRIPLSSYTTSTACSYLKN